jgi:hypothetical protein
MTNLIFDKSEVFDFKSPECKRRMLANGNILKKNNVRHVLLVHGTFVGDNALGFFDLLEPIEKKLTGSTDKTNTLKNLEKSLVGVIAKDLGNYTPGYAKIFSDALDHEVTCELFTWGSGNYHLARLKGAVELAQELANLITQKNIETTEKILLLGHSHAGQLFALLTTFLENGKRAQQLYTIMGKSKQLGKKEELLSNLDKIKTVNLDIVTFGTPVRYSWGEYDKYRLMAIVNHRPPGSQASIPGVLSTEGGDYIQQWGAEGTDLLPPDEKELNDQLDAILDKGRDISLLIESLKHTDRKQPHNANGKTIGKTLLVDYKDNASLLEHLDITHCVKTLFGHGVYTEMRAMLFNTDIIVDNLYKFPG